MSRALAALLIAIPLFSMASQVAAEPSTRTTGEGNVDKARTVFQQGVDLFHEGNFEAALAEFRKAYATAPSYRILYNIAQTYVEIHDYVNALKCYRQYLDDGGSEIAPSRRAQVEDAVQKLQARIAYVEVRVNLDGAEVRVDDVAVGTSPLAKPIAVNPGPRHISAIKTGWTAAAQSITAAGGDHVNLVLELSALSPAKSRVLSLEDFEAVSKPSSASGASSRSRAPLVVSLVATGTGAVTAGIFGWLALGAKHDLDHDLGTFKVSASQLDNDRSHLRTYALITDVAAGAALVAAGFSLYFLLSEPNEPASQTAVPRPFVALVPTLGGMAMQGGW